MSDSSNITQLLLDAQQLDAGVREKAENILQSARDADPITFYGSMAQELANDEQPLRSRQLAGLILKNQFVAKDRVRQQNLANEWISYEKNLRDEVKRILFRALGSKEKKVRHTAAQVIGGIGAMELQLKEWNSVFSDIVQNLEAQGGEENLKEGSLTCIGYICEDVDPSVLESDTKVIITFVVESMKDSEKNMDIRYSATLAFFNSLEFSYQAFESEMDRNYVMEIVVRGMTCEMESIRELCYKCLVKIGYLYYKILGPYLDTIYTYTVDAMKKDTTTVGIQAVEFWSTICEEEIRLIEEEEELIQMGEKIDFPSQNFIFNASKHLIPVLTELLTRQSEDFDPDDWTISKSAACCISLIATTIKDDIVDLAIPFVETNIVSENWRQVEAAIILFGKILEGPSTAKLAPFVSQAFEFLMSFLKSTNIQVKETAGWTIGKICQFHSEAIGDKLAALIENLLASLTDDPIIAVNACWSLLNLAEGFDARSMESSPLDDYFQVILEGLFVCADREDASDCHLRVSAYEAFIANIHEASEKCVPLIEKIIPSLLDRLESTLSMDISSTFDLVTQSQIQSSMAGAILASIERVDQSIEPYALRVMQLFLRVLENREAEVHEEVMMAIRVLVNVLEGKFKDYIEDFFPLLIQGIDSHSIAKLCEISIGLAGDIFRYLQKLMIPVTQRTINALISALDSESIEKEVKTIIIGTLGDIALGVGKDFSPYMETICALAKSLTGITVNFDDEDEVIYLALVRKSILDLYSGILHGLTDDSSLELYQPYLQDLIDFLKQIAQTKVEYRQEPITKAAVAMIGDLISSFGPPIKQTLNQDFAWILIRECRRSNDTTMMKLANWAEELLK